MGERRAFKKASIRDVAQRAAVSVTTVSHVVSGTPGYSAETIAKVREAIQELNYVPSYVANGLRQKSTRTIGVCASDPYVGNRRRHGSFSDRLWAGILEEADRQQYKVLHFPSSIRDSSSAGDFLNGQIDGLIILANPYDRRPEQAAQAGLPVVVVGRTIDIPESLWSVAFDERHLVHAALDHLLGLGHRRIGYIAGPAFDVEVTPGVVKSFDDVARSRLNAYEAWLAPHPEVGPARWVGSKDWNLAGDNDTLVRWIQEEGVTAILGANDFLARSAIDVVLQLGKTLAADVSVIGIDNDDTITQMQPPLSSLEAPVDLLGREAVKAVLALMDGKKPEHVQFDIHAPEITLRGSTGPVPK